MCRLLAPLCALCLALTGCLNVKVQPIEVTANVNVNVRLDKALNDFFGDLDQRSKTVTSNHP